MVLYQEYGRANKASIQEFFVSAIENLHESYVDFMLASTIIGATLSDEQIATELDKSERGEDNRFQNVLLTVRQSMQV